MKLVVIAAAVIAFVVLGRWARKSPQARTALIFALGFLPFTELVERASLNVLSHEWYRGDARGFEVTIVDLVAIGLFFALPKARWPMPYKRLALAWLGIATISVAFAWEPLYAGFGAWRVARVTFIGAVVARACEDRAVPPILLRGLAWGVVAQLAYAIHGRYVLGHFQVSGSFAHQNSLAMAVNLVAPTFLALLLAKGKPKWLLALALLSSVVCVVFSLSRGGLFMFPVALGLVYVGSLIRRPSVAKIRAGAVALVVVLAIGIKSFDTIMERFLYAPEASAEGRERFEQAASNIWGDHSFGVGMNNFSHVLHGPYAEAVQLPEVDHGGIVHHVYWLTLAETGLAGLLVYLALVLYPIWVGLRWFHRHRTDVRGDVILGITAGLIVTAAQGVLEWLARQTVMSYLVWIAMALLLALVRQLREDFHGVRPP